MSGIKVWSLSVLQTLVAALLLLSSSDELMGCCAAGINGCLDLKCVFLPSQQVREQMSSVHSMAC